MIELRELEHHQNVSRRPAASIVWGRLALEKLVFVPKWPARLFVKRR